MKTKMVIVLFFTCLVITSLMAQKKVDQGTLKVKHGQISKMKYPDLKITNIEVIKINKECKVEITIRNIGTAGVPDEKYGIVGDDSKASSFRVKIGTIPSVGRYLRKVDPDGKLKVPGGVVKNIWFKTDSFSTVPPGVQSITAIADDNSKITELDESNNRLTKRLICKMKKKPDLIVQRMYMKPVNPSMNTLIYFFAHIKNIGLKQSNASKASFKIGGETSPKIYPIPALNIGQSFIIKRKIQLSIAQNYLAIVIADFTNVVPESNENNNKKDLAFTVN